MVEVWSTVYNTGDKLTAGVKTMKLIEESHSLCCRVVTWRCWFTYWVVFCLQTKQYINTRATSCCTAHHTSTLFIINDFIKKWATKSEELMSDVRKGHASKAQNKAGIHLLWISCNTSFSYLAKYSIGSSHIKRTFSHS